MIRCPSASRQSTQSSSVARARGRRAARFSTTRATTSAADRGATCPSGARCVGHALESSRSTSSRTAAATTASAPSRPSARRRRETSDDLVVGRVEADVRAAHVVEDDEVGASSRDASSRRARDRLRPVRGEADEHLPGPSARRRAPRATSVVGSSSTVQRAVVLRPLARRAASAGGSRRRPRPSRRRRRRRARAPRARGPRRSASRRPRRPPGAGTARFAASSVTSAPRAPRLRGERHAHAARRAVADEAHGVERLARAARA